MRIQVDDAKKQVVIWMTNAGQIDKTQQKKLYSLFQEYKAKNYTVAIFRSGQEDLTTLTSHLLCHNRICAAKTELRQAKTKS